MDTVINRDGNKFQLILNGRLDTSNADKFASEIEPLLIAQQADITIDCSGLEYTSSQGLRLFLSLQKAVIANSGSLVMTNMDPKVKEIFDITGFSNIIKIL